MDNMSCNKVQPVLRKAKKKQVKDELDRIKQAEKKKRRLEKALATSAAIRKELEKKKQIKKEQERLDEEGAAIAEAVALHVLCDDPDDSCKVVLNKKTGFNPLDCDDNVDFLNSEREYPFFMWYVRSVHSKELGGSLMLLVPDASGMSLEIVTGHLHMGLLKKICARHILMMEVGGFRILSRSYCCRSCLITPDCRGCTSKHDRP